MPAHPLERSRLVWIVTTLIGVSATALLLAHPGEVGVRAAIVLTARTSLLLFLLAFSASSLAHFVPGRVTRWLLHNRRYLGLSFAASHGLHALAIGLFAALHPAAFAEHTRSMPIGRGLLAYAFIAAMAASSNDRALHWLGSRRWKALHLVGALYVWLAFFKATYSRVPRSAAYWLPVALLLAALSLRLARWALPALQARLPGRGKVPRDS